LSCIDLSLSQLRLTELRIETLRSLTPKDYLAFFDYPPFQISPADRKRLFHRISLQAETAQYWSRVFESLDWRSVLYEGGWERTFARLSRINQLVTGQAGRDLFRCRDLSCQRDYIRDHFPHAAWSAVMRFLGQASVFNALLYKGQFPKSNLDGPVHQFYRSAFKRLFHNGLARENFFLQIVFLGRLIYPEGNPFDARLEVLEQAKLALSHTKIHYINDDVLRALASSPLPVEFLSLSDVPSYFSGALERDYLQVLRRQLSARATVVQRFYLHLPTGTDRSGFEDISSCFLKEIDSEKVQVYRIEILRNRDYEAS
jgi:S-adenosylmethionine-diacylglycerol 3-amino-3-carboxypropyl transferase